MFIELIPGMLAQQTMPAFDGMYWLMLASRVLHILGAIILVGGIFYLRNVVLSGNTASSSAAADQQFGGRRAAWAMWVGNALVVVVAGMILRKVLKH